MAARGGVKIAAEMLSGLMPNEREKVLDGVSAKDPRMADLLRQHLFTIDDLTKLTPKMLAEFLREVDIQKLALALRLAAPATREFILQSVSKAMSEEISQVMKGAPRPVSEVQSKLQEVMEVFRQKIDRGEIILRKGEEDEYV